MAGQLSGQGPQPHHTGVQCSAVLGLVVAWAIYPLEPAFVESAEKRKVGLFGKKSNLTILTTTVL